MECKYKDQRVYALRFLRTVTDDSLLDRRYKHESEQAAGLPNYVTGSLEYGKRLIWMREVRTQIGRKGLRT